MTNLMQDDMKEVDQLVSVLAEQQKEAKDCLDDLDKLTRELTDQEQRRERTADRRVKALHGEIIELIRLQAALVSSGAPLVRNTTTEQVKKLKAALGVEEANRDRLDRIADLSPHERRLTQRVEDSCSRYVDEILELRKVQTAMQANLAPADRDRSGGSTAAAWSSSAVRERLFSPIRIDSPTRSGDKGLLRPALASFSLDGPVFLKPVLDGGALSAVRSAEMSSDALLQEGAFYELVGSVRPAWVNIVDKRSGRQDSVSAPILYGATASIPSFQPVEWPWACLPELLVRSTTLHPGFNAEAKSVSIKTWNELLTYVAMSIADALFSCSSKVRFYANPPVGYGVVSFPHCGYVVAVEWIGKLLATPYSQPFFIGSEQHKSSVAALPEICYNQFITVNFDDIKWDSRCSRFVLWTAMPTVLVAEDGRQHVNQFLKLVPCSSYDHLRKPSGFLRRLYKTYERYGAALAVESASEVERTVPRALLPARLWCGVFAIVVTMEFVKGKEATVEQLAASTPDDEKGARAIASAVVWLARRGLIYYDLREPNILVDSGGCWRLIDYDDMVVVEPGSVKSVGAMKEVLAREQHLHQLDGVLAAFTRFPKLEQFINDAFGSG